MMRRTVISAVVGATAIAACHQPRLSSGREFADELAVTTKIARTLMTARDTGAALALLETSAARAAQAPYRDLVHGHLRALESLSTLLANLAVARAALGDSSGARRALDQLLFETGDDGVLDSLQRADGYAALNALPGTASRVDAMRAMRRWRQDSAFVTEYRDTLTVDERVSGVSLVWAELRYNFVALGFQGTLSLDSVYRATLHRILQPMDTWEYYQEIERMMAVVGDNHTDVMELPQPLRRHRAGIPWETRRVNGKLMVTRLNSPSLPAFGIAVGHEVVAIEGLEPDRFVETRVPSHLAPSTSQARDALLYGFRAWQGELGTSVPVRLRRPDGSIYEVTLRRGGWTDAVAYPLVEGRLLESGVGYLAINTFGDARVISLMDSVLASFGALRGLIVDTRLNGGGSQDAGWHLIAQWLRAPFVQTAQYSNAYIGIWRAWGGTSIRVPMPERILRPDSLIHRSIPLLWLIGPRTASAAEGVAALVEQTGVGTTVGERTYGSTGQPILLPIPGGGRARVRVEEERFNDGRIYTRRGIEPQMLVPVTVEGIRAGRDEVLEAAVALMAKRLHGR